MEEFETTASQANTERGVLLQELAEEVLLAQNDWFERLFEAAVPLKDGSGEVAPPSPERRRAAQQQARAGGGGQRRGR